MIPHFDSVPRYKDFNTIRKNHHVKDEEVLRYVPYFGETDDVDVTEAYKVEVRDVQEEEDVESIFLWYRVDDRLQDPFTDCGEVFGAQRFNCGRDFKGLE